MLSSQCGFAIFRTPVYNGSRRIHELGELVRVIVLQGVRMKKFAYVAVMSAAVLTLAACGSSDSASEQASAENVEMPAEEAMSGMDAEATPVADPMAVPGAAASVAASDAASGAASPSPAASAAAEQATKDAEKKM